MLNVVNSSQLCHRLVVLAGTVFVVLACSSPKEVLPGVGPVEQFVRNDHHFQIFGSQDASQDDLFQMSVFGRYTPGFHAPGAIGRFGKPDKWVSSVIVEYMDSEGIFNMGTQQTNSNGGPDYPLWFYPNDHRTSTILPKFITDHLRPFAEKENVHLYECGYSQQFITVALESGQVKYMVWFGNPGLRENTQQCTP